MAVTAALSPRSMPQSSTGRFEISRRLQFLRKEIVPNLRCQISRFELAVGTMLAEMGEHQLTIRDYLRHSNLHVTNKYLQATSKTKRLAQDKLVDAILPTGILPKTNLIQ